MEIRLAKTAGFCFGVDRAVKLTYGLLDEGRKVATLGPLIHNPQTVEDLERRGALVADTPARVPSGGAGHRRTYPGRGIHFQRSGPVEGVERAF